MQMKVSDVAERTCYMMSGVWADCFLFCWISFTYCC